MAASGCIRVPVARGHSVRALGKFRICAHLQFESRRRLFLDSYY
jgi:hypothetical protein